MNETEKDFARWLAEMELAGEVLWWRFEGLRLQLANRTSYTPDFDVMWSDCTIEIIDVKPKRELIEDDARVKMKIARDHYPFRMRIAYRRAGKKGNGFILEDI